MSSCENCAAGGFVGGTNGCFSDGFGISTCTLLLSSVSCKYICILSNLIGIPHKRHHLTCHHYAWDILGLSHAVVEVNQIWTSYHCSLASRDSSWRDYSLGLMPEDLQISNDVSQVQRLIYLDRR
ncbi:hypothetical protein LIER_30464 [Lithospermum erythrorhizon]|uniref:Uncharacterized protein n=1 Tax=Lithospermum erythrorhizon TaxID=34254 RepID=A0AAV3RPM7_LITER